MIRNGKTLLSGKDPVRLAQRTADAVIVKDRTLYFCPSPLYGYGIDRLLSRLETEAPSSAILCVEADGGLYDLALKNIAPSVAHNKMLQITDICGPAELCALVREKWGGRAFRRIETVRFTGGWQLFTEIYDSLFETLRKEIAVNWSNAMTLAKLGRLYIRNFMRNLSLIPQFPSVEKLSFGSAPVLVLGAGPSLDETLDALCRRFGKTLREVNRPFKIICADTCLGALKERQISPDLAVILESQHWNLRDFIGCRGWQISAAVDLSALPQSARLLGKSGFLFMTPWTPLRIFERLKKAGLLPAVIPPLGSVGLTAAEIARRLTSGNIICAGLDFSFNIDKYHARGTPGHRSRLNKLLRFGSVLNSAALDASSSAAVSKSGFPVRTNAVMQNYRDLFEREFASDTRLFDIEGSGLPLGVKTLSVEEMLVLLSSSPSSSYLSSVISVPPCEILTNNFIEKERERLLELRDILSGEAKIDNERFFVLIEECDYLYAHFPDCAGGRRPEAGEISSGSENALSFLKRVRTEIDFMLRLAERAQISHA